MRLLLATARICTLKQLITRAGSISMEQTLDPIWEAVIHFNSISPAPESGRK